MRDATDADFNRRSRNLEVKLEIYFQQAPLVVTKSNYLIDADWLEEGSADSSNPFGSVSSNELAFRLLNKDGMFSPTNTTSPYYGLIKARVPVDLFIRPVYNNDEVEWEKLGRYYVTGWDALITGMYADVVANDEWHNIFSSPVPNYPVTLDKTYKELLSDTFTKVGYNVDISDALNQNLPFAFIDGDMKGFVQQAASAALAMTTTDKDGKPKVESWTSPRPLRATFTDADQIKSVSSKQSIIKSYDGVELIYGMPQILPAEPLVDILGTPLVKGASQLANIAFNSGPVYQVTSIRVKSKNSKVYATVHASTPWLLTLYIVNDDADVVIADVTVYGRIVSLTEVSLRDDVAKVLKVTNKYIQTASHAEYYKSVLSAFVNSKAPILNISVRGNPLLNIGDKVRAQSSKYKLDYTGLVLRAQYSYSGPLTAELTLLDASIFGGV